MKKLLFTIASAWMLCTASMKAQITLDKTLDSVGVGALFKPVQISPTETKYFFADHNANTFSLYNMDFTPFMLNISVLEPFDNPPLTFFQVLYISRSLFDCDSTNIEYVYTDVGNINAPFRIVRTDGTILFELDSANSPYCLGGACGGLSDIYTPIRKTSSGTKLFLQTEVLGYQQILIYSLCGELPMEVFDFSNFNETYGQSFLKAYPNPTDQTLLFQINLPDNVGKYELVIVDGNAKVVVSDEINSQREYSIDVRNFSNGTYHYSLIANNKLWQSGKFIITK